MTPLPTRTPSTRTPCTPPPTPNNRFALQFGWGVPTEVSRKRSGAGLGMCDGEGAA